MTIIPSSILRDAEGLRFPFWAISAAIVVFFVLSSWKKTKSGAYWRNGWGESLEFLPGDSRILRFTHGAELSAKGRKRFPQKPYLWRNGSITELVIHTSAQARDFYSGDGKDHLKPYDSNFGRYWERMLGACVGIQNGQNWHTSRSYMDPYFTFSQGLSRIEDFRAELIWWTEWLSTQSNCEVDEERGLCVDSVDSCKKLPFKLIAMVMYGEMLTEDLFSKLWDLNVMHEEIVRCAFLDKWAQKWWYAWLPTKANDTIARFEDAWKALNLEIIFDARKENRSCLAEKIYHAVEAQDMTMVQYLQTIDEILFTNIDVTSTMFAGSLINLARSSEVQKAVREEIESNAGEVQSYLRREDTLLHKTYMEVLRINPPAWYSLPENTAKDKRINGFLIPAGTPVTVDCHRLNILDQIWGEDGHVFRPQRFEKLSPSQVRYSMHGYGMGPRKCLGKNFANLIIKLLILTTLQAFDLSVEGDKFQVSRETFTRSPEKSIWFKRRRQV